MEHTLDLKIDHHTLDSFNHLLRYPAATIKPTPGTAATKREGGNSPANSCAAGQKVCEWAPIVTTEIRLVDHNVIQTTGDFVGSATIRLNKPLGQLHEIEM